ncbi:MAG TPA: metalloregulator ArsR/SmtB family transcription factor [Vicinamibacterales bacterium]|nr:metalloregulator ArsR/SmtB family transcription factor [Vicinamibacterales bacterium]
MSSAAVPIIDSLSALADATRCRMLWLLERQELTVSELCAVMQLPQSTVSRQLKTLADAGWVTSRRDGTSRYYALATSSDESRRLWQLTRDQLGGRAGLEQDARRLAGVLARRSEVSQQFFASAAGQWDRLRDDLFGADVALRSLVGLLPSEWVVGDLGCGTGAVVAALAPYVATVIGVDASDDMLAAARERTRGLAHVDLRKGSLEALPIESGKLDAATMVLVLHHLPSPAAALEEAARVLKPGGRLLIVDMAPHDREEYRAQMGHVWLGFADEQMRRLLAQAGFDGIHVHHLAPVPEAKGPSLISASGVVRRM